MRSRTFVRWVATCLLGVHLALLLGISVPIFSDKSVSERFPCEACPCGCSTAAFCWDKCCCHTDEQKLAWAERHRVTPPEFLIRRVNAKSAALVAYGVSKSPVGPKAACASCSCCASGPTSPEKNGGTSSEACESSESDATDLAWKVILFDPAMRCLGIQMAVTLFSDSWIPDPDTTPPPRVPVCVDWLHVMDESCPSVSLPVDGPVPWAA